MRALCIACVLSLGCGGVQEPRRESSSFPPSSFQSSEASSTPPPDMPREDVAQAGEPSPPPRASSTATTAPSDAVQIRLAVLERRAAELEQIARLITASREAALRDAALGVCGENPSLEELRTLATSGIAGSDAALTVRAVLDAWCERLASGQQARADLRAQRRALRGLESELDRAESQVRAERRTMLEDAEALQPLAGR